MLVNITDLTIEELHQQIKSKQLSPVELTQALLQQIKNTDSRLNAFITVYEEEALAAAKVAESEIVAGNIKSKFHGIPIALKDNIFHQNHLTTMGSEIHRNFIPTYNATVVDKLVNAGAILLGKLNLHEYALSITSSSIHFGPVKNPWNLDKIPGGSSGGSAAAIAVGSTPVSVGTDTAGSIRIPAAACGIVGLKPTRGLVSAYGVYPLSWTQDHVGPMAKNVKDTAALLEIIAGHDEKDAVSIDAETTDYTSHLDGDVSSLTIGVEEDYFFKDIDSPIEKATRNVIQSLVEKGAKVKEVKIPALKDMDWAGFTFSVSEASVVHYDSIIERPEDIGEDIRGFLQMGASPASELYANALKVREQLIKEFTEVFNEVDVIISPTLPVFPNNIGEVQTLLNGEKVDLLPNFIRLTGPANITGLPALSVPSGVHEGLPMGIQIIGNALDEKTVLNVGYAIEQLNLMEGRKPKI
ncbi:MAG: amidase [Balneolaceae bacterium]